MPAPPKVVAEIGCNHKGDLEIAKEMISVAENGSARRSQLKWREYNG